MEEKRDARGIVPVGVLFFVNAAMWTSIGPRLADIAENLGVTEGALGLALGLQALGLLVATLFSPLLVQRVGVRRVAIASAILYSAATAVPGYASTWLMLAGACLLSGVLNAPFDLTMNSMGVALEKPDARTGVKRKLMARFEVGFNLGVLASSGVAAWVSGFMSVSTHLTLVGLAGALIVIAIAPRLPRDAVVEDEPGLFESLRAIDPRDRLRVAALSLIAAGGLWAELMIPDWSALLFAQEHGAEGFARGVGGVAFAAGLLISLLLTDWLSTRLGARRLTLIGIGLFLAAMVALPFAPSVAAAAALLFVAAVGIAPTHPLAISATGEFRSAKVVLPIVMMSGYVGVSIQRPVNGFLAEGLTLSEALTISSIGVGLVVLVCSLALSARRPATGDTGATA